MIIHPVAAAIIRAGGMEPVEYAGLLDRALTVDTTKHDDPRIRSMTPHVGGHGSRAIVMTAFLTPRVAFVSGPDETASRLTLDYDLPRSAWGDIVGRHVTEVVDHPLLRVPGMNVADVHGYEQDGRPATALALTEIVWEKVGDSKLKRMANVVTGLIDSIMKDDRR